MSPKRPMNFYTAHFGYRGPKSPGSAGRARPMAAGLWMWGRARADITGRGSAGPRARTDTELGAQGTWGKENTAPGLTALPAGAGTRWVCHTKWLHTKCPRRCGLHAKFLPSHNSIGYYRLPVLWHWTLLLASCTRLGKLPRKKEENVNNNKRLCSGCSDLVLCQGMK